MHTLNEGASLAYVLRNDPFVAEANAVQAMRMVDAFSSLAERVILPLPTDHVRALWPRPQDEYDRLMSHFGLNNYFRVVPIAARPLITHDRQCRPRLYHRRAMRYLAGQRPDLIITRSERVVNLCAKYGLPVVFETHAGPDERVRLAGFRELRGNRYLRGVVTIHDRLANLYVEHGIPKDLVLTQPDGIPEALLARQPVDQAVARSRLGLNPSGPIVLYTGSLQHHKGIPTLIEAARGLPAARFILAGRVVDLPERLAGDRGIPDNCLLVGHRPPHELPLYLDAADVCVLPNSARHPSAAYTSPLKLFEYMASGTPIVASAIPAVSEVVKDNVTACLFRPDDPEALVKQISLLLSDPQLRQRLAKNARELVTNYTWERRAAVILDRFLP